MEGIALIAPKFPLLLGSPSSVVYRNRQAALLGSAFPASRNAIRAVGARRVGCFASAPSNGDKVQENLETPNSAILPASTDTEASTVWQTLHFPVQLTTSYVGSPLLWIGVGIALSAIFSVTVTQFKRKAIREAFKAVMDPSAPQNGQFNAAAFSPGSPMPPPGTSPAPIASSQAPAPPAKKAEAASGEDGAETESSKGETK
ncbi:protein TIC 40, chloroplastic-like [Typha angustifolia]|uniref:protein TIC 40, chloroplastic-like n=1 Tax=Typha angustifolia TaxID=59011 RepID=UPI003C2B49E9